MNCNGFQLKEIGRDLYIHANKEEDCSLTQLLRNASTLVIRTVSQNFRMHSVYCYNLSPLMAGQEITYKLQKIRDGRNIAIRFVEISQEGKPTLIFEFSFQNELNLETTLTYVPKFPRVKDLSTFSQSTGNHQEQASNLFDIRTVSVGPATVTRWFKLREPVSTENSNSLLLMLSDYDLFSKDCNMTTEHSVWFHETGFDEKDWFLHEAEITNLRGDRSLIRGRIWSHGGRLLLSFAQEKRKISEKSKL